MKRIILGAVLILALASPLIVGFSLGNKGSTSPCSKQLIQTIAADTMIFEDDFENYTVDSFPSIGGWEMWFNGAGAEYQTIVDSVSFSPPKCLQLWGYDFWAAFAARRFSTDFSQIGFHAYVNVAELVQSSRDSARISFTKWTSPSTSTEIGAVTFQGDGRITSGNQLLGTYAAEAWYKVSYLLDRPTATYNVWIDDKLCGENLSLTTSAPPSTNNPAYEIEAFSLSQCYNQVKIYFDNVQVFGTGEHIQPPVPPPSPPPGPPPTPPPSNPPSIPPNPPPTPVAYTILYVDPANVSEVAVGSTFKVTANVFNATDLFTWQTLIKFNVSVLNCVQAVYPSTGYIFSGKAHIPVSSVVDNIVGTVVFGGSLLGNDSASGDGVLCEITFQVVAMGETSISFSQPYGASTFLLTGNLDLLPATLRDSAFSNDSPISEAKGEDNVPHGAVDMPDTSSNVTLGILPYENQYLFSVESNSTVTDMTFDSTSRQLNFVVSGDKGTSGYTRVTIAKSLIVDTINLRIRLDGNEHDYSLTDADYSWLLLFTYNHSSHLVEVGLGKAPIPEFPSVPIVLLLLIAIIIVTKIVRVNHARRAEPSLPPA